MLYLAGFSRLGTLHSIIIGGGSKTAPTAFFLTPPREIPLKLGTMTPPKNTLTACLGPPPTEAQNYIQKRRPPPNIPMTASSSNIHFVHLGSWKTNFARTPQAKQRNKIKSAKKEFARHQNFDPPQASQRQAASDPPQPKRRLPRVLNLDPPQPLLGII